jgi:hypothetical protein
VEMRPIPRAVVAPGGSPSAIQKRSRRVGEVPTATLEMNPNTGERGRT